jgi:hypothetical protein
MKFYSYQPSSAAEMAVMSTTVGAVCIYQRHSTGLAIGLDFNALDHSEATRFVAEEKAKGHTVEQTFASASATMIKVIDSTAPHAASVARFLAATCVVAARELNGFGVNMNCLSADDDPSGKMIAQYVMCAYANPFDFMRNDIGTFAGPQPPAA